MGRTIWCYEQEPSANAVFPERLVRCPAMLDIIAADVGCVSLYLWTNCGRKSAYINSTTSDDPSDHFLDAIIFDLTNSSYVRPQGLYGASVIDHGDFHGASSNVLLVKDYQEFEYAVGGTS